MNDREYIFTFGMGQKYENCFHAIQADNAQAARDMMFQKFGSAWSMQYDAPNAREKAGVDRWNLKEIK